MPSDNDNSLDSDIVLDAFQEVKDSTDAFISKNKLQTYCADFLPRSDKLAIAIFCNAFEELGCPIRSAASGTKLERIKHVPAHQKLVDYIYAVLEKKDLIQINGSEITRTSVACPSKEINSMIEDLLRDRPAQDAEIKLMQITGPSLAKCLSGKTDGIQLIFGAPEGRTLLDKLYATSDASSTVLQQLEAFIEKIGDTWPTDAGPLRILEIGAGTGGTTSKLLPALKRLGIPVVYTMTDLSSLLVTEAASTFKQYNSFVKFEVLDIEKEPAPTLQNSQHIVLGSNVIHATRSLSVSLDMIHKMLRSDGLLIFHELTTQMLWADVIFGLFEGWWRFGDGREHALQSANSWAAVLKSAGYGYVDWTDGRRPEAKLQKLIFAMASEPGYVHSSIMIICMPLTYASGRFLVDGTMVKSHRIQVIRKKYHVFIHLSLPPFSQ